MNLQGKPRARRHSREQLVGMPFENLPQDGVAPTQRQAPGLWCHANAAPSRIWMDWTVENPCELGGVIERVLKTQRGFEGTICFIPEMKNHKRGVEFNRER